MWKWMLSNREWLFSGLGILAITGLGKLLIRLLKPNVASGTTNHAEVNGSSGAMTAVGTGISQQITHVHNPVPQTLSPEESRSGPSVAAIRAALSSPIPYQVQLAKKHLEGVQIDWNVVYHSMILTEDEEGEESARISTYLPDDEFERTMVAFSIKLSEFPDFRHIAPGRLMRVRGLIESVQGGPHIIRLRPDQIRFIEQ